MVLATGLTERGCSLAATVHPPTRSTGAAAEETTPHQGTTRTTTTIDGQRSAFEQPTSGVRVPRGALTS
jgi:hypothetical protein